MVIERIPDLMNAYTDLEVKAMENMMVVDSDYEEDQEEHKIMI